MVSSIDVTEKGEIRLNSKINVGLIGLGARGMALLSEVILKMDDVQVISICDLSNERLERAKQVFESYEKALPLTETDYMKVITNANVDAVIVSTSWTDHSEITIHAMEEGKYVACEVGGAFTIEECWKLVHTYEKTKTPCMLLENCCFGRDELMVLNMVHKGVLGEIVHCSGGYHHDLRHEIATGRASNHYRMDQYLFRNCENYPTHELGPIARVLDIHRGNRMVSLVSVSSKSKGLNEYIHRNLTDHPELAKLEFAQGDGDYNGNQMCTRGNDCVDVRYDIAQILFAWFYGSWNERDVHGRKRIHFPGRYA